MERNQAGVIRSRIPLCKKVRVVLRVNMTKGSSTLKLHPYQFSVSLFNFRRGFLRAKCYFQVAHEESYHV